MWREVVVAAYVGCACSALVSCGGAESKAGPTPEQWAEVIAAATPLRETVNGTIQIVELVDYECECCRTSHTEMEQFLGDHPEVLLAVVQLPLSEIHPSAEFGARAALCAERQGRFAEAHRYLFEQVEWMEDARWGAVGKAIEVDSAEEFLECVESSWVGEELQRGRVVARGLGIAGTPTLITARRVREGGFTYGTVAELLGIW